MQLRNRHRRRRRCTGHGTTTPVVRRHDSDSHFRRSVGSIWADRRVVDEQQRRDECQVPLEEPKGYPVGERQTSKTDIPHFYNFRTTF